MTNPIGDSLSPQPERRRRATARCPHCEQPGICRQSAEVTILHRDMWFVCSNPHCGHSWKATLSFVHTVAKPAQPRAGLDLPVSPLPSRRNGDPPMTEKSAA